MPGTMPVHGLQAPQRDRMFVLHGEPGIAVLSPAGTYDETVMIMAQAVKVTDPAGQGVLGGGGAAGPGSGGGSVGPGSVGPGVGYGLVEPRAVGSGAVGAGAVGSAGGGPGRAAGAG